MRSMSCMHLHMQILLSMNRGMAALWQWYAAQELASHSKLLKSQLFSFAGQGCQT